MHLCHHHFYLYVPYVHTPGLIFTGMCKWYLHDMEKLHAVYYYCIRVYYYTLQQLVKTPLGQFYLPDVLKAMGTTASTPSHGGYTGKFGA